KQADVAIDTDQELRAKFASDAAALEYLASLAAAATSIYERDVAVRLRFSYIRLWGAASADPWTATDPSGALGELRTYWNDPGHLAALRQGFRRRGGLFLRPGDRLAGNDHGLLSPLAGGLSNIDLLFGDVVSARID